MREGLGKKGKEVRRDGIDEEGIEKKKIREIEGFESMKKEICEAKKKQKKNRHEVIATIFDITTPADRFFRGARIKLSKLSSSPPALCSKLSKSR